MLVKGNKILQKKKNTEYENIGDIRTSQKMKKKSQLSIEKDIIKFQFLYIKVGENAAILEKPGFKFLAINSPWAP